MIGTLISSVNENYYHLEIDDREVRALIAGTLVLMTHFAEAGTSVDPSAVRH